MVKITLSTGREILDERPMSYWYVALEAGCAYTADEKMLILCDHIVCI